MKHQFTFCSIIVCATFLVSACTDASDPFGPGSALPNVQGSQVESRQDDFQTESASTQTEYQVDTVLTAYTANVGQAIEVTCVVTNSNGQTMSMATTVRTLPAGAATVQGHTLTGSVVGDMDVQCGIAGSSILDPSPARLSIVNGTAAKTIATLSQSVIEAGTTTHVTCSVQDSWGNAVAGVATTVHLNNQDIAAINGSVLTGQKSGQSAVTCIAPYVTPQNRVAATLTVTAGQPASLKFTATPEKAWYKVGDTVILDAHVVDAWQNIVTTTTPQITGPTQGVTKTSANSWTFQSEGTHIFTASASNVGLQLHKTFNVDDTAPYVELETPVRGSIFTSGSVISVHGRAYDTMSGIDQVKINGSTTSLNSAGNFTKSISATHGLNKVLATASDESGQVSEASASAYHSWGWQPYGEEDPEVSRLMGAMPVFISQEVLDDGDQDLEYVNDLASLMAKALENFDLAALGDGAVIWTQTEYNVVDEELMFGNFPVTLQGDAVFSARVADIVASKAPDLEIDARKGGMAINGDFAPDGNNAGLQVLLALRAELPINVSVELPESTFGGFVVNIDDMLHPYAEWIVALNVDDFEFSTYADVSKLSGQPLDVDLSDLTVNGHGYEMVPFETVYVDLGSVDLGIFGSLPLGVISLDDLLGPMNNLMGNIYFPQIISGLHDLTATHVTPVLANELTVLITEALESLGTDSTITASSLIPHGQPRVLALNTALDTVQFNESGGHLALSALTTGSKGIMSTLPGSILRERCNSTAPNTFNFSQTHPMEVGFHLDFLNQVVHAAWWAGAFDTNLEMTDLVDAYELADTGLSNGTLTTKMLLPPIFDDCNPGKNLQGQLADMRIDGEFFYQGEPLSLTAYITIDTKMVPTPNGSKVHYGLGASNDVTVTVVDWNGHPSFDPSDFETIMMDAMAPVVLDTFTNELVAKIPLPTISFSHLDKPLTGDVDIDMDDLNVWHKNGVLAVRAEIQ